MDFLKRAEQYAEHLGDGNWFRDVYTQLRQHYTVTESVWATLQYLYGSYTADLLEMQEKIG